jgi:hypothetical protein
MMKNRKNIVAQDDDLVCAFADVVIFEIALVPTMAIATMETNEDIDSGATIKLDAQLLSKEQNIILVLMEDSCVFQVSVQWTNICIGTTHSQHIHMHMILNTFVYIHMYLEVYRYFKYL